MKKFIYVLIAFTISFGLLGCSDSKEANKDISNNEHTTEEKATVEDEETTDIEDEESVEKEKNETKKKEPTKNKGSTSSKSSNRSKPGKPSESSNADKFDCPVTKKEWDASLPNYYMAFQDTNISFALDDLNYYVYIEGGTFDQFNTFCDLLKSEYPSVITETVSDENSAAHFVVKSSFHPEDDYIKVDVEYTPDNDELGRPDVTITASYNS